MANISGRGGNARGWPEKIAMEREDAFVQVRPFSKKRGERVAIGRETRGG